MTLRLFCHFPFELELHSDSYSAVKYYERTGQIPMKFWMAINHTKIKYTGTYATGFVKSTRHHLCLQHQFLNPKVQLKGGNNHIMCLLLLCFAAVFSFHRLMTRCCIVGEKNIYFQPNIWKHGMASSKGLMCDVVMGNVNLYILQRLLTVGVLVQFQFPKQFLFWRIIYDERFLILFDFFSLCC